MTIKRKPNKIPGILKINMVEEGTLKFRLIKIDETRNYLLDKRGRGC